MRDLQNEGVRPPFIPKPLLRSLEVYPRCDPTLSATRLHFADLLERCSELCQGGGKGGPTEQLESQTCRDSSNLSTGAKWKSPKTARVPCEIRVGARSVFVPGKLCGSPTVPQSSANYVDSGATAVLIRTPEPPAAVRSFHRLGDAGAHARAQEKFQSKLAAS